MVVVTTVMCGALAAGLTQTRHEAYRSVLQIGVGAIEPLGFVEDPDDLARRMSSRSAMLELADLTPQQVAEAAGVDEESLREDLRLTGQVLDETGLVRVDIVAPTADLAKRLAVRAAATVQAQHQVLFDAAYGDNKRRIAELETVLASLRQSLDRSMKTSRVLPNRNGNGWVAIADLATHIGHLKESNLPPKALRTRIVSGPDATQVSARPSSPVAVALGLVSGFMLALVFVVALEVVV